MSLLITTIILFVIVLAIIIGCAVYRDKVGPLAKGNKKVQVVERTKAGYKLIPIAFLTFGLLIPSLFTTIPANSVGIIYNDIKGGVQDNTYGEGYHVKSIFEHITTISTANRSAKVNTTGQTNDGQYATFELSIIYKINKNDAGKFYRISNAEDISKDALETIIKSTLQSSTIKYNIFELLSTELEHARIDFKEDLASSLYENYYVTLVDVAFDEIDGGSEVEAILQASAKAQQQIDIAKLQAEANLITANNEAEVQKIIADAAAYAITAEGNAQGEAASAYVDKVMGMIDNLYTNMENTLTYEQCADMVLSIVFYDTWDGVLPEVLTSDSLSAMVGGMITNGSSSNDTTQQ